MGTGTSHKVNIRKPETFSFIVNLVLLNFTITLEGYLTGILKQLNFEMFLKKIS